MQTPVMPADEAARRAAVHATGLLDSPAEERFDRLTRLACRMFDVPVAIVSLVDDARQWFKSRQGVDVCETPREISFCGHSILSHDTMIVPDAREDPRFADNPLVTGPLGVRFYAGAPLRTASGHVLGTLCILDRKPRALDAADKAALRDLADCVEQEIDALDEARFRAQLAASEARSASILQGLTDLAIVVDRQSRCIDCNDHPDLYLPRAQIFGQRLSAILPPALLNSCIEAINTTMATGEQVRADYRLDVPGGAADFDARFQKIDADQALILIRNTSREKATEAELQQQHKLLRIIARVQLQFIGDEDVPETVRQADYRTAFHEMLAELLTLTTSEYAFFGKVERDPAGAPKLRIEAFAGSGHDDAQALARRDVAALDARFGGALERGDAVIVDDSGADGSRPNCFLGVPVVHRGELVAMIGLANRPGGYDPALVDLLLPLRVTLGQLVAAARIQAQHRHDQRELERFKATLDRTLDCVFMFDTEELRCFYGNEGALRQIGYRRDELLQMHPWDLAPDLTPTRCRERLAELGPGGLAALTFEAMLRHRSGSSIPVEVFLQRIAPENEAPRLVAVVRDITERKHAEAILREQVAHTGAIVDNMVDGVIAIAESGVIVSFNLAAERIFGQRAEHVIGKGIDLLLPNPQGDVPPQSHLRRFLGTSEARIIGARRELEGRRADGTMFPIELAVSQVTRQGRPMYVGMFRDITERKRDERMKREFVSTVSHELRTPLTCITGALGLISGGVLGKIDTDIREMLDIAYSNARRLTDLINDLLDMEKVTAGKMHFEMSVQPLLPIVEHTIESNRAYGTGRRVTLVLVGPRTHVFVKVDSLRLNQVLANLLSNAIKFSREGSQVEVAVVRHGSSVAVSVRDHGRGIPAAFRDRVFQKFAQADASDTRELGGTGLGLAITQELLARMDGHIDFESVEGAGTTFTFELPVWDEPLDEPAPRSTPRTGPRPVQDP